MNSFKTELFKISFEIETTGPCVIIENIQSFAYTELFSLSKLCENVLDLMQNDKLSSDEAIRIVHKASSFFVLNER